MKESVLLDRAQAVIHIDLNLILATVQEHNLKSELACNNYRSISLQFDLYVFIKNEII